MSEIKKVKPYNKPAKAKRSIDPLLRGYRFEQLEEQLKQYESKYKELPNTRTKEAIEDIQKKLEKDEFKFTPILHSRHWCCGVITHDKIYVFDSTLQTQIDKSKKEGVLKIGTYEKCPITYLNHGKQIQSDNGRICGPCVVEFSKKIAELNSIQEVLDACKDGTIFKNIAQEIYNKLQVKSSAGLQFTEEYYNIVDKVIIPQQKERPKQQLEEDKQKEEKASGLGCLYKEQQQSSKEASDDPFFKESFAKITSIETVEEINYTKRSRSLPTRTSKLKGELLL